MDNGFDFPRKLEEITVGVLRAEEVGRCGKSKNIALRFRVADSLEHWFVVVRTSKLSWGRFV